MEQKSMTALVSAFARWYHAEHNAIKVFDDTMAGCMLTPSEKEGIAQNMGKGIAFFHPGFQRTESEALRWIVDNQLSPSPLGRAAFCEAHLQSAVASGIQQYLILAAGYDTFAYRQPGWAPHLQIIEIDHPVMSEDKLSRLASAGIIPPPNTTYIPADFTDAAWSEALRHSQAFDPDLPSFCSLLGISYYLSKAKLDGLLASLSQLTPKGSYLVLDYPDQDSYTEKGGMRAQRQAMLARGAQEDMLASYSHDEMESLLRKHGFMPTAHLVPSEITARYFAAYSEANPVHPIEAFDNVNYCAAIKS